MQALRIIPGLQVCELQPGATEPFELIRRDTAKQAALAESLAPRQVYHTGTGILLGTAKLI